MRVSRHVAKLHSKSYQLFLRCTLNVDSHKAGSHAKLGLASYSLRSPYVQVSCTHCPVWVDALNCCSVGGKVSEVLLHVLRVWMCADEAPLCQITEGSVSGPVTCTCTRAKSMASNFCKADPGNPNSCGRYNEFNALDGQVGFPSPSLLAACCRCCAGGDGTTSLIATRSLHAHINCIWECRATKNLCLASNDQVCSNNMKRSLRTGAVGLQRLMCASP